MIFMKKGTILGANAPCGSKALGRDRTWVSTCVVKEGMTNTAKRKGPPWPKVNFEFQPMLMKSCFECLQIQWAIKTLVFVLSL